MSLSIALQFKSERFDYQSSLPESYNAGNRFYGQDLAEFLADSLSQQGLRADFMDEDWGWLVCSRKGEPSDFEIAIYNLAEHGEGGRPGIGAWGLWIQAHARTKLLGLLPRRTAVPVPASLDAAIRAAIRAAGAEAEVWSDGPGER